MESAYHELRAWLTTKISWFEQAQLSKDSAAPSMDYEEYLRFRSDYALRREAYERLKHLQEANR